MQLPLAGDVAKIAQAKNLGTLLNEVYPDGSKAPDDFSDWVVEMQRPSVPVSVEIPISKDLYYPSAGELRSAYAVKSLSGKTSDLDRIIELGNALNRRIQYCQVDWMLKILTCLCDTLNPPFQSTLLLHNYQAL